MILLMSNSSKNQESELYAAEALLEEVNRVLIQVYARTGKDIYRQASQLIRGSPCADSKLLEQLPQEI